MFKFSCLLALSLLLSFLTLNLPADSILPEGFIDVKIPGPTGASCKSCNLKGNEEISMADDALVYMNFNLDNCKIVNSKLLEIELGNKFSFFPSEKYSLLPQGSRDGDKDFLIARIGQEKIGFKVQISEIGNVRFYSVNYPGWSIRREGERLLLGNVKEENDYLFSSDDSGYTWRVMEIRSKTTPEKNLKCEYSKDGLLTSIILPDSSKYTIEYKNGLAVRINDPTGTLTEIIWDERSYIKTVKTTLLPEHPFYVKESARPDLKVKTQLNVIRSIQVECDNMGRILTIVNTSGEKFTAEYRYDKDSKTKSSTLTGLLKFPDNRQVYCQNIWLNDGAKNVIKGSVKSDKNGETLVPSVQYSLKKKASTMTVSDMTIDGQQTKIGYDRSDLAVTSRQDELGRTTTYKYDNCGRKVGVIYPDKTQISYKYDDNDYLIEKINEECKTIKYIYEKNCLKKVDEAGIVTSYEYDSQNKPIKTILPGGIVHNFEWDNLFRLVSHTRPDGVKIQYIYAGRLSNIIEVKTVSSDGVNNYSDKYSYDTNGKLLKITYTDGTAESFSYDCCNLVKYTDKAGAVTRYIYDASHRRVTTISPSNEKISFTYDSKGNLLKTIYPNGTSLQKEYDKFENIVKVTQTDGTWKKYAYDAVGNMISMEKSDGTKSEYVYDLRNRLTERKGDAERNIEYVYTKAGKILQIIDHGLPYTKDGRKTEYTYDASDRRTKVLFPEGTETINIYQEGTWKLISSINKGIITQNKYNQAGQLIAVAEYSLEDSKKVMTNTEKEELFNKNIIKTHSYNNLGRLFEIRNGKDRLLSRSTYSSEGELQSVISSVSETGAIKQTYTHKYDSDGVKIVSVYKKLIENPNLSALDYQEQYSIYKLASVDATVKPDSLGTKVMEYAEKNGRRIYLIDQIGQKTEYKYNEKGQLIEITSNDNKKIVYKYDIKGRLYETEDILGRVSQRIYGTDSHIEKMIQADGTESLLDYDKFGYLIKRDGAGFYSFAYNYTSFGEIASSQDAQGVETKFVYDKFGRLQKRIWTDGSEITYKYNSQGQLTTKDEAGKITGYIYDDMNMLVKVQTFLGKETSVTEMAYDKDGNLIRITDGKTSISYKYDDFGRVIMEDGPVGTIRYVYNSEGLLFAKSCELKENSGQFVTKYYYDDIGRVSKVESQAGTYRYSYDKKGRIESLSIGDAEIVYTYDKVDRLVSKKMRDTVLCSYQYDKLNRRTKAEVNGIKWDYAYDQYNQLISAKADDGKTYNYEYDKVGNRLKSNQGVMAYSGLNQIAVNGYQYDKWGNLIKTPDASYKYDLLNRLIEVKKNDISVKYSYDPLGQRIESVETDKSREKITKFIMSGMVEQARVSGGITQYHTLGLDLANSLNRTGGVGAVLASTSNNSSFNYLYDGNGNVVAASDNDGNISEKISYSPFGEIISGKTDMPFTFSTKAIDSTGLSYYGFRYYNQNIGRWINRDPLGEISFHNDPMYIAVMSTYEKQKSYKSANVNQDLGNKGLTEYAFGTNNPIIEYDIVGLENGCVCPEGSKKGKRQEPQKWNGCGASFFWVPNDPIGIFTGTLLPCDFVSGCNHHDACYSTCGRTQWGCDSDLLSELSSLCSGCASNNFSMWNPLYYTYLAACESAATTYSTALMAGGTTAYLIAQKNYCVDCCCN